MDSCILVMWIETSTMQIIINFIYGCSFMIYFQTLRFIWVSFCDLPNFKTPQKIGTSQIVIISNSQYILEGPVYIYIYLLFIFKSFIYVNNKRLETALLKHVLSTLVSCLIFVGLQLFYYIYIDYLYVYSETSLIQTLNKTESCIN